MALSIQTTSTISIKMLLFLSFRSVLPGGMIPSIVLLFLPNSGCSILENCIKRNLAWPSRIRCLANFLRSLSAWQNTTTVSTLATIRMSYHYSFNLLTCQSQWFLATTARSSGHLWIFPSRYRGTPTSTNHKPAAHLSSNRLLWAKKPLNKHLLLSMRKEELWFLWALIRLTRGTEVD